MSSKRKKGLNLEDKGDQGGSATSQSGDSATSQSGGSPTSSTRPSTKVLTGRLEERSEEDGRLDAILRSIFSLSNKQARKLISTGKVSVHGQLKDRWESKIRVGDLICVNMNAPNPKKLQSLGATLIYQDNALAVLAKPSGLLSAPIPHSDEESALQAASRLCRGPRRPRVVHRLDKETSGLILFARTIPASRALQEAIRERQIRRVYRCIVKGRVKRDAGYISSGLIRDTGRGRRGSMIGSLRHDLMGDIPRFREVKGQWALTQYQVIQRGSKHTALEVELFTGRTHQIRIHLSELGHPILGEWVYGYCRTLSPRLALHAAELHLTHPFSGEELSFQCPWPSELSRLQPLPKGWAR